jgi:hypothetical protein
VKSITTEDISVGVVLKGQTDTRMLKIAVKTDGEKKPLDITGFMLGEADFNVISDFHIYQTGTVDGFSANEEFNGKYTITDCNTYYFWLAYDIRPDAAVGQTATASLVSIVAGGETIAVSDKPAVTASVTVAQGKSGTYTVGGADADYATIQGAIDNLGTLGMEGPVTLNIRAGEYNERVRTCDLKNSQLQNTAESMRLSILGKDSKTKDDKPLGVVDAYVKENTTELVDPLDIKKKIESLEEKSNTLLKELDTQIKVSNATTLVEIA